VETRQSLTKGWRWERPVKRCSLAFCHALSHGGASRSRRPWHALSVFSTAASRSPSWPLGTIQSPCPPRPLPRASCCHVRICSKRRPSLRPLLDDASVEFRHLPFDAPGPPKHVVAVLCRCVDLGRRNVGVDGLVATAFAAPSLAACFPATGGTSTMSTEAVILPVPSRFDCCRLASAIVRANENPSHRRARPVPSRGLGPALRGHRMLNHPFTIGLRSGGCWLVYRAGAAARGESSPLRLRDTEPPDRCSFPLRPASCHDCDLGNSSHAAPAASPGHLLLTGGKDYFMTLPNCTVVNALVKG
jgi:hypothetical protein